MLLAHLVEDCGARGGRRYAIDSYVLGGELLAERLCKRDHARLGRGIGGRVRIALLAGDRGDVDDASVALGDHGRNHGFAAVEDAVEIKVDHPSPVLDRIVGNRRVRAGNTGVVDENVDPAGLLGGCRRRSGNAREIAHVAADREGLSARSDFCGGFFGERHVPVPDRNLRPGRDQAARDRAPDSLRAAGDDSDAAFEIILIGHVILPIAIMGAAGCRVQPVRRLVRNQYDLM